MTNQKPESQKSKSAAARTADRKALRWALVRQLLLTTGLVILWIMLWDGWSVVHIVTGIIVAVIVTRLFYLPPIELSGRINPWYFAVYLAWFAWQLARGALQVAAVALRPRKTNPGSVIAVDLHTRSDLLITIIAQTAGLIPGTFVTEVDALAVWSSSTCSTATPTNRSKAPANWPWKSRCTSSRRWVRSTTSTCSTNPASPRDRNPFWVGAP